MADSKTRKAATTKYIRKLTKIYETTDEQVKQAAALLIKRAAFLLASLDELEQIIYEQGYIAVYTNGANQQGTTVSPAVKTYKLNMTQLLDITRQLRDYLPTDDKAGLDELQLFVSSHKKIKS